MLREHRGSTEMTTICQDLMLTTKGITVRVCACVYDSSHAHGSTLHLHSHLPCLCPWGVSASLTNVSKHGTCSKTQDPVGEFVCEETTGVRVSYKIIII